MTTPKTAASKMENFLAQRPERNPVCEEALGAVPNPLRVFREEKHFSQRDFAARMGISRSHLQRLETKPPRKFILGEILQIARAFSMRIEDLIFRLDDGAAMELKRTSWINPSFILNYQDGIRLSSFLDRATSYFAGMLHLPSQKTLAKTQTPRSDVMFFCVLEGELLLTLPTKEYVLKKGEAMHLGKGPLYELYNPNAFKETQVLIFAYPSFTAGL